MHDNPLEIKRNPARKRTPAIDGSGNQKIALQTAFNLAFRAPRQSTIDGDGRAVVEPQAFPGSLQAGTWENKEDAADIAGGLTHPH